MTTLSSQQLDRAAGSIVGLASGDALGAGYEFGPPLPDGTPVHMNGGGGFGWAPGEWTDDTSMAMPILSVLSSGRALDSDALDEIVAAWAGWARTAKDVGNQTRAVLGRLSAPTWQAAVEAAASVHSAHGRSGGNGSLMRTAPVALGFLHSGAEPRLAAAARAVSELTHFDPDAGDACVLWSLAIRHAVLTGVVDVRVGLDLLPAARRDRWALLIADAEALEPRDFDRNGWVVEAFQGAWSAISHALRDSLVEPVETPLVELVETRSRQARPTEAAPSAEAAPSTDGARPTMAVFVHALERAVRGGRDTDTVAAIAGSLIGAATGISGIPAAWRRKLHGWPGLTTRDLMERAVLAARGGASDSQGWPAGATIEATPVDTLVQHPLDDGVWLGSLAALRRLPAEVDAVVSLCRVGHHETEFETVEFWLVDRVGANVHLRSIVEDAADTIASLRAEGRTVFVHCAEGRSRTPTVAAAYSIRHFDRDPREALAEVVAALPAEHIDREFRELVATLRSEQ